MNQRTAEAPSDTSACALLFVRLAQVSSTRLTEALEGMGLRPREFAVLHHLAEAGPSTQLASSPARCGSTRRTWSRCSTGSRPAAGSARPATPRIAAATPSR